MVKVLEGNNLDLIKGLADNSIDSIVTDPPYGLGDPPDCYEVMKDWVEKGYHEVKGKGGFMGKCYHPNTDILTEKGWVKVHQVEIGDSVASLNASTNELEYIKVSKTYKYYTEEELVHVKMRSLEQVITQNHNVFFGYSKDKTRWGLEEIGKINTAKKFYFSNQALPYYKNKSRNKIKIGDSKYNLSDFCYLFGLYLGDGYCCIRKTERNGKLRTDNFIGFSVKKHRKYISIKKAIENCNIKYRLTESNQRYSFVINDDNLIDFFQKIGKSSDKHIPRHMLDLDASELMLIYKGMIESDGNVTKSGQETYVTVSKKLADDFQELCLKIGKSCVISIQKEERIANVFGKKIKAKALYRMSMLNEGKVLQYEPKIKNAITKVDYKGFVYCVELSRNHILYTRYNGKPVWSGNSWDNFVPQPIFWKEVYRVLKPGGHVLCFAGTRTQDWMMMALRFSGFEIRDVLSWVYGCLSEDTEILTKNGWERYDISKKSGIFVDNEILIYDAENDIYKWEKPQKWSEYSIHKDTAYRIKSDTTDQIVSRNHRCLVEREGKLVFIRAEALQPKENIPILEDLSMLQQSISNQNKRASNSKQVLLKKMYCENDGRAKKWQKAGKDRVQGVQKNVLPYLSVQKQTKGLLLKRVQRKDTWRETESTCTQRASGLVRRNKRKLQIEQNGKKQPCVEGWANLYETERQVCKSINKVRKMPSRVYTDGEERWLCNGTQAKSGNRDRQTSDKNGMCTSYKPQCRGQQNREFNAIQNKCRPQKIRTRTSYKTTLATIEPIEYTGVIFCPTVSTGAFVARRNGKIFLTGNSGFPKGLNIGEKVDELLGNEREDLGRNKFAHLNGKENKTCYGKASRPNETKGYTEWEGWKTCLKPAFEPITLARKPISEKTIALNVLKWGTGGINIDECRVGEREKEQFTGKKTGSITAYGDCFYEKSTEPLPSGRFPANLIHDGSEEVLTVFPQTKSGKMTPNHTRHTNGSQNGIYGKFDENHPLSETYGDEGSAARFFYCAKASKSERNEGLGDFETKRKVFNGKSENPSKEMKGVEAKFSTEPQKNTHVTVKPIALMRYLVRLVTPKGGTVLDPFCGSGTTGIACALEGFNGVMMEQEKDYVAIAKARIEHWSNKELEEKEKPKKKKAIKKLNQLTLF